MGYGRSILGTQALLQAANSGGTAASSVMAAVNNAISLRFVAPDTRDVASVWINWAASTAPGTVRVRIETDSSGKPSGVLYDANATVDITPALGWQQCSFAIVPTTHLIPNTLYHIVLITTVAGTAQSLKSGWAIGGGWNYPLNVLTATDGSTRANFAESTGAVPLGTIVLTDGTTQTEETLGFASFATSSNFAIYGTRAYALKVTVPAGVTLSILGVELDNPLRNGTPDDLRVRILDTSNSLITGATAILPRNGLLLASGKRIQARFASAISLPPGTYRVVVDQWNSGASATASGNNWTFYAPQHRAANLTPSYFAQSTSTDGTTWTDAVTFEQPLIGLQLNDVSGGGGGGTVPAASDVRNGTAVGSGAGTLVVPSAANVLTGTTFDNGTVGTATVPAASQVLLSVTYGAGGNALTGNVTLPAVGKVRNGQTYGASLGQAGTDVLPSASNVASGIQFGAGGTEFTGTYASGGGVTLSQIQSELDTRGLTSTWSAAVPANITKVNGSATGVNDGTAQAGAASTITLSGADPAGTNAYVDRIITIVAGTGQGQSRVVSAYNSATKVVTVHRAWDTVPDTTSQYAIDGTSAIPPSQLTSQSAVRQTL